MLPHRTSPVSAAWLFSTVLLGCGGAASNTSVPSTDPGTSLAAPDPAPGAIEAPPGPVPFEVHEWGLLDVIASTGMAELAAGPGRPTPLAPPAPPAPQPPNPGPPSYPPTVRKPVLYVHLGPGVETLDLAVEVELPGGRVLEHWPASRVDAGELRWDSVRVSRGSCASSTIPPAGARLEPCAAADGYCELHELASYRTSDADCLRVGADAGELLFYRGSYASVRLPVRVERLPNGRVAVTNQDAAPIPGRVLRVVASHDRAGVLRTTSIGAAAPAPGERIELASPTAPVDAAAARAALASEIEAMGLTREEARTFLDAWSNELFTRPSVREVVLYWLPADAIDELAELRFSPAPSAVRRAMMVRVELSER